jgi:uncharacterized protein (TIRG00374 family)
MSFKNILFFLVTLTIGIFFFLIISGQVDWSQIVDSLRMIKPWQFALLVVLTLGIQGMATLSWQETLRHIGYRLPWHKLWRIMVIGTAVSFVTPMAFIGGEAIVLYLLNMDMRVPWRRGINSLIIYKLADFLISAILILIGLIIFWILIGFQSPELVLSLSLVPIGAIAFSSYAFIRIRQKKGIVKPALHIFGLEKFLKEKKGSNFEKEEAEIVSFFDLRQSRSRHVLGATVVKTLLVWLQIFCLFFFITGQVSFSYSLVSNAFAGLSLLFLLPAGLGSMETLQAIGFGALGLGKTAAIGLSFVWRGMFLIVCAIGIVYLIYFSGRILEDKADELFKKLKKFWYNKNPRP